MDGTSATSFTERQPEVEPEVVAGSWRRAYARQAASDFAVYDVLCMHPEVEECQRMHYLQMALEKAAKAHFWQTSGSRGDPSSVNRRHRVAEKFLPGVFKDYWFRTNGRTKIPGGLLKAIRTLCREVDLLAPAVLDGAARQDNCEYPWEVIAADGSVQKVLSPLDHEFAPSSMVRRPGTAGFLKAIRASIDGIVGEGPNQ
jgi:hypothetical protein